MKRALPWAIGGAIVFAVVHFARDKGMEDPVVPPPSETAPAEPTRSRAQPTRVEPNKPAPTQQDPAAEEAEETEEAAEPAEGSNPFAVLLDSGQAFTDEAAGMQDMSALDPEDDAYDPLTEARQIFHDFENDLRGHQPLNPPVFKQLLKKHKETNAEILRRADALRKAGQPEYAADMMGEWSRLYGHYQAQAYGRRPVPTD